MSSFSKKGLLSALCAFATLGGSALQGVSAADARKSEDVKCSAAWGVDGLVDASKVVSYMNMLDKKVNGEVKGGVIDIQLGENAGDLSLKFEPNGTCTLGCKGKGSNSGDTGVAVPFSASLFFAAASSCKGGVKGLAKLKDAKSAAEAKDTYAVVLGKLLGIDKTNVKDLVAVLVDLPANQKTDGSVAKKLEDAKKNKEFVDLGLDFGSDQIEMVSGSYDRKGSHMGMVGTNWKQKAISAGEVLGVMAASTAAGFAAGKFLFGDFGGAANKGKNTRPGSAHKVVVRPTGKVTPKPAAK